MRDRAKRTLNITIDNVTEAQEIALNDLFATWQQLGSWGSSRWTAFFADGDGDFRPKITINGEKAKHTDLIDRSVFWSSDKIVAMSFYEGDAYKIDFDWVGDKLQEIEDKKNGD
jgi:hypothetical protein